MGFFGGGKKGKEESSPKPKKKKKSPVDDDGDGTKRKKIKKMRMRLGKKRKKKKDDSEYDRRGRHGRDVSFDNEDREVSGDFNDNGGYGGGSDFQLDMVQPGMRLPSEQREPMRRMGGDEDNKKFRVKPYHAFPSPVYMNESELYQHMMSPTEEFEFLTSYLNPSTKATRRAEVPKIVRKYFGSPREDGRIGSLRVEVLGCVGLDRAKPEISVYLVVGDCAFATDIIQGARSPMWPNTAKRAAVFPLHHAYARLFVGVFDVKERKKSEADHYCGRVAIDIPPLRPDTEYDVTFPLRASTFIYDRRPRGVVRIRFSLHWFSERAAITSYLKRPRNPLAFSRQAKKQPTIPCGDPKTFRNVAVTVHGQDFPGKYTRGAFRATMREFNLYQQNLRFLFKVTIIDCILWENPVMSLYLFGTSMYCIWLNSVRYVPPFFIGWIILLFYENYRANCNTVAGHLGYQPPTILEVLYGLLRDGKDKKFNFKPILVKKRPRKQVVGEDGKLIDIELANHREFPFSERFTYLKFSAADAIAPSPSKKKGSSKGTDLQTARRLSIYTSPVEQNEEESDEDSEASDEDSEEGERDEEGMMDQGDDGYEVADSDDEEEEEEDGHAPGRGKGRLFEAGKASTTRRIRVGPEQNSDKSGRKVPPQIHLSRVEHLLHRATKNISVEHVHFPPPHLQMNLGKDYNAKGPASDVISAKEKQNFDEFDRLLGFRTKNPNPILRITSSFLGPLMRIIRIAVYATRIGFNVTAWTDPFLTFWFFAFLCAVAFILFIFPWRTFLFLASLVLLGPQNIAVRKYLERRAKEKEMEEHEAKEKEKLDKADAASGAVTASTKSKAVTSEADDDKAKSKRKWGRSSKKDKGEDGEGGGGEEINEADLYHSPRPAFYAHTKPTKKNQVPRDVAVPYFRFRKDRFYDWPPDPTVSRATPMLTTALTADEDYNATASRHASYGNSGEEPRGVRRRRRRQEDDDFGYG